MLCFGLSSSCACLSRHRCSQSFESTSTDQVYYGAAEQSCISLLERAHRTVNNPLEGLQQVNCVGGLAASDPVIMMVLCQFVDLLQCESWKSGSQAGCDVCILQHMTTSNFRYGCVILMVSAGPGTPAEVL